MANAQTDNSHTKSLDVKIDSLHSLTEKHFKYIAAELKKILGDVLDLYDGKWSSHESCQVGYHTAEHALEVALATARMIVGWNKQHQKTKISSHSYLQGVVAALFHDAGYIKQKGDHKGKGGKYTFTHVNRGIQLVGRYLQTNKWKEHDIQVVQKIISLTEFHEQPDTTGLFAKKTDTVVAKIVATADIIAQMADIDYLSHIDNLFEEFNEAYQMMPAEELSAREIRIFKSTRELLDGTMDFYKFFVLPRLVQLGDMDKYLVSFYGSDRNPYMENIDANLSGGIEAKKIHWRRLGEIFEELGLASKQQIESALDKQRRLNKKSNKTFDHSIKNKVLDWFEKTFTTRHLGDIMMDSNEIDPAELRQALLAQVLPPKMIKSIRKDELVQLVNILILLNNIQSGPWLFEQVMEIIKKILSCEASSILLANHETKMLQIVFPTGPKRESLSRKSIPIDKGLAGWVYSHNRPAVVSNATSDLRFTVAVDAQTGFQTRSILAVPLNVNGQCIGVMELINKIDDNFTEHDMNLVTVISNLIGNSLAGAIWLRH